MNINNYLNNPNNFYYGHGTGTYDLDIINKIMRTGLRCSHNSLYYTTKGLGEGKKISPEAQKMLKNWEHKESKIIAIVSLPKDYIICARPELASEAFYFIPDEETQKRDDITSAPHVYPEFIVGYYDATNDSFTNNPKYYENLSLEEQKKLFEKVKRNYFDYITCTYGDIDTYKAIISGTRFICTLTNEDIETLTNERKIAQVLASLPQDLLEIEASLPSGEKTTMYKYLETIVLPNIPLEGYIVLKNGARIPVKQFLIECVMFDCQKRYNGDFSQYLKDNVDVDATNKLNNAHKK